MAGWFALLIVIEETSVQQLLASICKDLAHRQMDVLCSSGALGFGLQYWRQNCHQAQFYSKSIDFLIFQCSLEKCFQSPGQRFAGW